MNTISNQQLRRPKRAVDKQLKTVVIPDLGTTQNNTVVRLSVIAETFTSMKLTIGISKGASSADGIFALAVVKQQEGAVLGTIAFTDDGQLYSIDNDLLYGRYFAVPKGVDAVWAQNYEISVNAQRKLKIGDTIAIIWESQIANGGQVVCHSASFFKQ